MATEHLIKQGCKNIFHFAVDLNLEIYQNRLNDYKQALIHYKFNVKEENIIYTGSSIEAGIEAIKKLWKGNNITDAIFSASDSTALGVCQELKKQKIKIPEEVAVIGFSNEPFTQFMELPMSSVDQTPVLMGNMAGQVFLDHIKDNSSGVSIEKKVILAPKIIIRKSLKRK